MKNTEQSSVKYRLAEFLAFKKLSQKEFEKACGLSNGYVNNIRKSIKTDTYDSKISPAFPELNKVWLLFGEGPMLNENKPGQYLIDDQDGKINSVEEVQSEYNKKTDPLPEMIKMLKKLNINSIEFDQILSVMSDRIQDNALQIEILNKNLSDVQGKLDKIVDALIPQKLVAKDKQK